MVPALILAISVVSLVRFAMSYFRAILIQAGQLPVSDEVRAAARLKHSDISGEDFGALRGVHSLSLVGVDRARNRSQPTSSLTLEVF